jgi:hypothetical protein
VLTELAQTSRAETASNRVKSSCFTNCPVFKAEAALLNGMVTSTAMTGDLGVTLGRPGTGAGICGSVRILMVTALPK